jgi:hypothetical protein
MAIISEAASTKSAEDHLTSSTSPTRDRSSAVNVFAQFTQLTMRNIAPSWLQRVETSGENSGKAGKGYSPSMEGLETIRALVGLGPRARIIAVSGSSPGWVEDYLQDAAAFGARGVLQKPVTLNQLLPAVSEVLAV